MDNMNLIKKLPPMLSGSELEQALTILPEYDPAIINENEAMRLIALTDIYKVFVPNQMSREIYSKLYLALLRSLQKKEGKLRVKQGIANHQAIMQQEHCGILGGSDSFTIIGASGIGKSSAISRAVQLLTKEPVIEIDKPYGKILPCVLVQCPFDSSVKGLLLEIIRVVDEQMGSSYYPKATSVHATTDMLIGTVSQICLNHIGILIVDEIQNVAISKNGRNLLGALLQLINCSGISICMVGTPECAEFFTQAMQLARRSLGLQYESMEYGAEFEQLCQILFQYQYVKNPAELDAATVRWLFEHSNGNVSSVVTLLHDAQELAILEGSEVLSLETLNADEHGGAYSESWCAAYREVCLKNFDLNMEYFSKLDKAAFDAALSSFLSQYKRFVEVTNLNDFDGVEGFYIMVLDEYKQVYIGKTGDIRKRILKHWSNTKPFDRTLFPMYAWDKSSFSIDFFRALDTTRIYVWKKKMSDGTEAELISNFPTQFCTNRIGGDITNALQAIGTMKKRQLL